MIHAISKIRHLLMLFVTACLLNAGALSLAQANEQGNASLKIPTTVPAIWQAIDEQTAAIAKAIKENQLTTIHQYAFAIRDLVKALPGLSSDLSDEQRAAITRDSGYVEQLATRLDKTGDANDKDGTQTNFEKLQKILEKIRANYATLLKSNK
jgi:CRISPR/Cas system CSM-associated protein Csm2 small subunit